MLINGKASAVSANACAANGGDADNDGICADNDCDDTDANVGAKQTVGTACNDGNAMTENDVIQSDGCTCAGVAIDNSCPVDYLFSNNRGLSGTATGTQLLETDGAIESTQTIAVGANITYDSKTQITLQPGFHAVAGSTFRAVIDGCSTSNSTENNPEENLAHKVIHEDVLVPSSFTKKEDNRAFMKVFPNPTTGIFTVAGSFQGATIQLFTANGQLLEALSNQSSPLQMNLGNLPSGLYFIRAFSDERKVMTQRIVKKD